MFCLITYISILSINYEFIFVAFDENSDVKHIFFIAETKGTLESFELRPIENAKIECAKKIFNEISTENVVYHNVTSYQNLLEIMPTINKK